MQQRVVQHRRRMEMTTTRVFLATTSSSARSSASIGTWISQATERHRNTDSWRTGYITIRAQAV